MTKTNITLGLLALLLLTSCDRQARPKDAAVIKANYSSFRSALQDHDHKKAAEFVTSEFLALFPTDRILVSFASLTNADMRLTDNSWIQFDREAENKAVLFPQRPPTVGTGFVRGTNGWKITTHFVPWVEVMD